MAKHRRYSTDRNHGELVEALRAAGCTVVNTAMVGDGFPDLVVGFRGRTVLLEVKDKGGSLEASQRAFLATWRGGPIDVAFTIEEALKAAGVPATVRELSPLRYSIAPLAPGEKKTAKARARARAKLGGVQTTDIIIDDRFARADLCSICGGLAEWQKLDETDGVVRYLCEPHYNDTCVHGLLGCECNDLGNQR